MNDIIGTCLVLGFISLFTQIVCILFDFENILTKKQFLIRLIPFIWVCGVWKWFKNLK